MAHASQESFNTNHLGLFTDYYELLMAQGYLLGGRGDEKAAFDYYFRKTPFDGGYAIFAGLQDLLAALAGLHFTPEDLTYLRSIGFQEEFLHYLSDFRFRGTIRACREGEVVFPREPVVCVEGGLIETQLIETLLLNFLNFESLIATKASRMRQAAGPRAVAEFGLRRAHGFAGIQATRAAAIGGVGSTSNVLGAELFGLTVSGTQAHSWVQSFESEIEAFREFARRYPDHCTLLVDTRDTLESGVPNAIIVAREMEARGQRLAAIRLDSGDLAYLSKKAREMLDAAGLSYVKIVGSNQLDETLIKSLIEQGARIDIFGVGTSLVTGAPDAALDGVYKLCMIHGAPRMKVSDNPEKTSLPGLKKVIRCTDLTGHFMGDGIVLEDEQTLTVMHHPMHPETRSLMGMFAQESLHRTVMEGGEVRIPDSAISEIASFAQSRLDKLPAEHRRFEYPHIYRVGLSPSLLQLRSALLQDS